MAALVANGWFLRPTAFAYSSGVDSPTARFNAAFRRWPLFIALWLAAFALLPAPWVSFGLAAWCAWIVRDLQATWNRMGVQEEIRHSPGNDQR